jgi:hypothetical protein
MGIFDPDESRCYELLYGLVRRGSGLAPRQDSMEPDPVERDFAEAMPMPGTESTDDQTLIFLGALCGNLENWYHVEDSEGVTVHRLAEQGLRQYAPQGITHPDARLSAKRSLLAPLSLHFC